MGLSAILLKEKDKIVFNRLMDDVKTAASKSSLKFKLGKAYRKREDDSYEYVTVHIKDKSFEDKGFLVYAYDKGDDFYDDDFKWIRKDIILHQVLNIESFWECEDILLDFVLEYLKLNPKDLFYTEMDWYYTFDDIKRIAERDFDDKWCYKPPHLMEEK